MNPQVFMPQNPQPTNEPVQSQLVAQDAQQGAVQPVPTVKPEPAPVPQIDQQQPVQSPPVLPSYQPPVPPQPMFPVEPIQPAPDLDYQLPVTPQPVMQPQASVASAQPMVNFAETAPSAPVQPQSPVPSDVSQSAPEVIPEPTPEPGAGLNPYTIVIVEDNPALSDVYKIRLELIGYTVFTAMDGQEALEVIERVKPDLVLLDMMLPRIAGDEVLRRMRATEWGKDIRVFIISNLNEHDAPAGLRQYNIEGYAVKANLHDDQLDQLVEKILTPRGQEVINLDIPTTIQH